MQLKATGYIQPCPLNKTGEKSALNQREVGLGHSVVPPGHGRRHHSGARHLRTELKAPGTGRGSNNGLKTPPHSTASSPLTPPSRVCPLSAATERHIETPSVQENVANGNPTESCLPPSLPLRPSHLTLCHVQGESRFSDYPPSSTLHSPRLLDHYYSIIGGDGGRAADA